MAIAKGYTNNNTTINPLAWGNGPSIAASNISQNTYAIQGKMLTVQYVMSDYEYSSRPVSPDEIKMRLMTQLVEKMCDDAHIEFTKMLDPISCEHKFHARIFVVPDVQVRILREQKVATINPW